MHTFLISLELCIFSFSLIILSKLCAGVNDQYEACLPRTCGRGPNISFPFHILATQQPYCGYPGFVIICRNETPFLQMSENEYVVEDIFYHNRSLHVFNAAVLSSNGSSCARIRNTTLLAGKLDYVSDTSFRLLSGCKNLTGELSRYEVSCGSYGGRDNGTLALYQNNGYMGSALERCGENVVASVELYGDEGDDEVVDVAEVLRRGFVMNWTASDCSVCDESGGRCGFEEDIFHFKCFCPDRPHSRSCKPENHTKKIILAITIPVAAILILLVAGYILWQRKKKSGEAYLLSRNLSYDPSSKSDVEDGSFNFGIPIFSYTELVDATCNFDPSKELGDGGFGTVSLRHPNLVSLYGCTSRKSRELLLVYEYIPNGTVADHLHGERANESPLTWPVRMNIARETAAALAYLHKSDIVHRDVKTNNILLDINFSVKVADFGLSRLFPTNVTHISTAPQGTPGYVDPEYHQCYQLTDKSDVYSFGVVLIELISSMPRLLSWHSDACSWRRT